MLKQDNSSFWIQSLDEGWFARPETVIPATMASQYDIAIVGGGFSGLWLAYYLKQADHNLTIAIFEAKQIAYGASGRNGGWLSTNIPAVIGHLLKHPHIQKKDVQALQRHVIATIDEVDRVCQREQIDCDLYKGGLLFIATNAAQQNRLQGYYQQELEYGFLPSELRLIDAQTARQHINIPSTMAAIHYDFGARIQPAKLALGLKQRVLAMGVHIFENTPVQSIAQGRLHLCTQAVNAAKIICCTEGYSDQLLHDHKVIPVNSSIIMTKPLPDEFWQQFGWQKNELLGDLAHLYVYAQKTRDHRILFGGRGAPYQYNSVDAGDGELDAVTTAQLRRRIGELFPDFPIEVDMAWKGSLGVTRDWEPSVALDVRTGLGWIYGFGGNGVGPTNLAARTMADKIFGKSTSLTTLPWNDYVGPTWECEPWRWIGIQSMYKLLAVADQLEYGLKLKKSVFFSGAAYKICGLE